MKRLFNKTFFRFVFGFGAILLVAFMGMTFSVFLEDQTQSGATQTSLVGK